jgi:hypothetical protein
VVPIAPHSDEPGCGISGGTVAPGTGHRQPAPHRLAVENQRPPVVVGGRRALRRQMLNPAELRAQEGITTT